MVGPVQVGRAINEQQGTGLFRGHDQVLDIDIVPAAVTARTAPDAMVSLLAGLTRPDPVCRIPASRLSTAAESTAGTVPQEAVVQALFDYD
jgi:hypothetical protein